MRRYAIFASVENRIDTKIEDQDSLQDDLNKLVAWSDKWLLKFNPEKCKVLHIGHGISDGIWND